MPFLLFPHLHAYGYGARESIKLPPPHINKNNKAQYLTLFPHYLILQSNFFIYSVFVLIWSGCRGQSSRVSVVNLLNKCIFFLLQLILIGEIELNRDGSGRQSVHSVVAHIPMTIGRTSQLCRIYFIVVILFKMIMSCLINKQYMNCFD